MAYFDLQNVSVMQAGILPDHASGKAWIKKSEPILTNACAALGTIQYIDRCTCAPGCVGRMRTVEQMISTAAKGHKTSSGITSREI